MEYKDYFGYKVYEDGTIIGRRGKPMAAVDNGRGYLIVSLYLNKRTTTKAVHVLVAECFVPNPEGLPEVDHKWPDKRNNHYSNLQWTTRGGNIKKTFADKCRSATGVDNARSIVTEEEVREICNFLGQGYGSAQIRDMGYPYNVVRSIKIRKNWTHISCDYTWS
ncbi:hypothetical protein [Escherichia phage vB_EcoM-LTH01]